MQPFWLNEKTRKKAKVVKPLGKRSYIVESSGQFYFRNRRHLKRSAADGNPLAVEELLSLTTDDKPAMEPVATSSVNQPKQTATIAVHKDQPTKACHDLCMGTNAMASKDEPSKQQVLIDDGGRRTTPTASRDQSSREQVLLDNGEVRTQSGRLVRPPSRFRDFVTHK